MTDAEISDVSAFLSRIQALPEAVEREWNVHRASPCSHRIVTRPTGCATAVSAIAD
jgi:hypothetical protein